jgi:hypothetical protein
VDIESDSAFMATQNKPGQNYAQFYLHPVKMNKKSEEAGRDIYEDRVYVLILSPGQTKSECRRPMQERDKRDYPQAWADFQNGNKEPTVVGTPIEYLGISPARAKELRAVHIHTIEQMAECSETTKQNVGMDFFALKNRAAAYVSKSSPELSALQQKVAELTQQLAAFTEKKKPGRPKKAPELQAAA